MLDRALRAKHFDQCYVAHYGSLLWSAIQNLVAQIWNFQNKNEKKHDISPKFRASGQSGSFQTLSLAF